MFKKLPLHQYFFLLLVILLPAQLAYHFWPQSAFIFGIKVDYLAPTVYLTDIVVVLLLVAWMWEVGRGKIDIDVGSWTSHFSLRSPASHFTLLTSGLFVYLLANSLLVAQNQPAALYKLVKLTELFLLGFYVSKNWKLENPRPELGSKAGNWKLPLSAVVIYTSLIGIVQFFLGRTLGGPLWLLGERSFTTATPGIALQTVGGQEYLRVYSIFSHPNSFAGFLLVAAVLLLPWKTSLTRVAAVLGITAFILTFSQGAWFAAVLLMGLWLIQKLRVALIKPYAIGLLVLVALLTTSVFWWNSLLPQTQEVILRQGAATASLQMIYQTPLFGVGLNNFIVRLPEFSSIPQVSWFLQPVHNVFLLVASETGLVGLALFLWLLYKATHNSQLTTRPTTHYPLLTTALLAMLITGALDHYWLTLQQNQLLASIVLGGIFSERQENANLSINS